jgi:hypothetical protein
MDAARTDPPPITRSESASLARRALARAAGQPAGRQAATSPDSPSVAVPSKRSPIPVRTDGYGSERHAMTTSCPARLRRPRLRLSNSRDTP